MDVNKRRQEVKRTDPCTKDRYPGPAEEGTMTGVENVYKMNCISMRNTVYTVSHLLSL